MLNIGSVKGSVHWQWHHFIMLTDKKLLYNSTDTEQWSGIKNLTAIYITTFTDNQRYSEQFQMLQSATGDLYVNYWATADTHVVLHSKKKKNQRNPFLK